METPSLVIPPTSSVGLVRRGVNIKEAAELLGTTSWFIETEIRRKRLKAHKLGRGYTIFVADLDAYVDRLRSAAA